MGFLRRGVFHQRGLSEGSYLSNQKKIHSSLVDIFFFDNQSQLHFQANLQTNKMQDDVTVR